MHELFAFSVNVVDYNMASYDDFGQDAYCEFHVYKRR